MAAHTPFGEPFKPAAEWLDTTEWWEYGFC
jgi:hypothetical protein